jgi:hypothetical protein
MVNISLYRCRICFHQNNRDFHISQTSLPSPLFKIKKQSIKSIESYVFDLDLSRKIFSNWSIDLGIQYSLNYQKYVFKYTNREYIKNETFSPRYSLKPDNTTHNYYHKYNILNTNISIGGFYTIGSFQLNCTIGLSVNLEFNVKGRILNENLSDIGINSSKSYRTKLNPRFFGEVSLYKLISKNVSLISTVEIQSKTTLTDDTSNLPHKILPVFFKIGINYCL